MQTSNRTNIVEREVADGRQPLRQWYSDALIMVRRMMLIDGGRPRRHPGDPGYKPPHARRCAKRRRRMSAAAAMHCSDDRRQTAQIQSSVLDAMISQMQMLTLKIEAAARRVEEVSDKAEAAEQTALKMAELTALAATELAAFAATDQAKVIGFRDAPRRRRSYGYSPNMDA